MPCVAQSLHLVVGGALVQKKGMKSASVLMQEAETEEDIESAIDESACEQVEEFVSSTDVCRDDLETMREIIAKFRRSSKATNRLKILQSPSAEPLSAAIDCVTRWNSTLFMIERPIVLRNTIDKFFAYVQTPEGSEEMGDVKVTRPKAEQRFAVECLVEILRYFGAASTMLGRQQYPSLVLAFPALRTLKKNLKDAAIFNDLAASVSGEEFVPRVLQLMHSICITYVRLFTERFTAMPEEVLWVSYLDPRFSDMKHLTPDERAQAEQGFVEAAFSAAKAIVSDRDDARQLTPQQQVKVPSPPKATTVFFSSLFGHRMTSSEEESFQAADLVLRHRCKSEFTLYLSETADAGHNTDLLAWWRENKSKFPITAKLARKWLGCIATSAPSGRAFSTSGNVGTWERRSDALWSQTPFVI